MRVREILFKDFRSFRGERRISFVDSLTDRVRPVSVLAGSNGSGKTTVLEAIDGLLALVQNPDRPVDIVREAVQSGLIVLTLEIWPGDLGGEAQRGHVPDLPTSPDTWPKMLNIAAGRQELTSGEPDRIWAEHLYRLRPRFGNGRADTSSTKLAVTLRLQAVEMQRTRGEVYGGLIYFPYDRRLGALKGGAIEPPASEHDWLFRYEPSAGWKGSLEQLWVWQNYLDLEEQAKGVKRSPANLRPFVTSVENLLGEHRKIRIEEGRVVVTPGWAADAKRSEPVRLDQLPSGEQQVVLLFGELARRRRKGAIIAVDEVENSLHPTLQRLVMWNLARLAREWDAQVIVATHSSEIINSVRGGAFVNLDYPEDRFNLPIHVSDEGEAR